MGPAYQVDVVLLKERLDHRFAKGVADATVILPPTRLTFLRIRPQQITEQAVLRDIRRPGDLLELGDSDQFGAEAAMHTQYFVID